MTRIGIQAAPGRARLTTTQGPLSPRLLSVADDSARVALVATTALLLGGDHIRLDVEVGPGARLELIETAGTVAYDAEGVASSWTVTISVAAGGVLVWLGEPFVVASGANVWRRTSVELAAGAAVCMRETLVLGRTGEVGGAIRSTMTARHDGALLLAEDLDLTSTAGRGLPGVIGTSRVLDSVSSLGVTAPDSPVLPAGGRFDLDGPGSVARSLTDSLAESPMSQVSACWALAAAAEQDAARAFVGADSRSDRR